MYENKKTLRTAQSPATQGFGLFCTIVLLNFKL